MGSESNRLWDAVSKTQQDVAHMRGILESKLPDLATQDDVIIAVNGHELKYHKRRTGSSEAPPSIINKKRLVAKAGGALTAVTMAGWGVYEVIRYFMNS